MTSLFDRRMTAEIDGDFVVLLIGMRINKPWLVHKWMPVARAMFRMIKELEQHPESGFLGYEQGGGPGLMVQYWRSYEQLERFARDPDQTHFPAWVAFNKANARARGDVGIWHETYSIRAGEYETVYSGMPAYGLGKVGKLVPATGKKMSARERLRGEQAPADERLELQAGDE